MVVRKKKTKTKKMRGSRTCGYGRQRQHRGAGRSGGRGKAGLHKHKWTWVVKYAPDYFGRGMRGYKTYKPTRPEVKAVNVGELCEMIPKLLKQGLVKEESGKFIVDVKKLGFNKVLGGGEVTRPLVVISPSFSKKAVEKIKEAGGNVVIA